MIQLIEALKRYPRHLLEIDARGEVGRAQRLLARQIRVVFLVARWEVFDRLKLHAQALTYDTLLALVPFVAVTLAVIKGFGGMDRVADALEDFILSNLAGSPDMQRLVGAPLHSFVVNIQTGSMGAISIFLLILSVLSLLGHIEFAFNTIFGSRNTRPWLLRLVNYWTILTLGPVLLGVSLALSFAATSTRAGQAFSAISAPAAASIHVLPLVLTWMSFTALYVLVPQRPVYLSAALPAAVVAGSLWVGAKLCYGIYVHHAFTLENIYGSLAAVPLFILWLNISWLLVLFGAQLAYALQHAETYRREDEREPPHPAARELALCRLFFAIAGDHVAGHPPRDRQQLARSLNLPNRLVEALIAHLIRAHLVAETDPKRGVVPIQDLSRVSLANLLHGLRHAGSEPLLLQDAATLHLQSLLQEMARAWSQGGGHIDFRALVLQLAPAALAPPPAAPTLPIEPPVSLP